MSDADIKKILATFERLGHALGPHNGDERLNFHIYRQCTRCNTSVYAWSQNGQFKCKPSNET